MKYNSRRHHDRGVKMNEMTVEGILISMMSEHRILLLKEVAGDRHLPIWIGQYEADAIVIGLRNTAVPRPLTHDLLANVLADLGATVSHIEVHTLEHDTFYSYIVLRVADELLRVDARPSDAIALAVRINAPIFVSDAVLERAGITVDADLSDEEDGALSAFRDFVNTMNLDDLTLL